MRPRAAVPLPLLALLVGACAARPGAPAEPGPVARPAIVPHAAWEAHPPVGHPADATRRNLAPGDSLRFRELTLVLHEMVPPRDEADTADAVLELRVPGDVVRRTVPGGAAFNWRGYHIAVLAVNTGRGLGAGLTELEIATVESLPPEIAASTIAGDATLRLRVPHRIHTITLHHSGSAEPLRPEDDPIEKLQALQVWGQRDRNWWDVPYHYLIDLEGTIYQGRDHRYMGETNTSYDPSGHFLITAIGNYSRQEPTPAQVEAIIDLMAWAAAEYDVPPERILGHGDLADTSCPGTHLRRLLDDGTFRAGVERRLREAAGAPR